MEDYMVCFNCGAGLTEGDCVKCHPSLLTGFLGGKFYLSLLPNIRAFAHRLGYAVAVHGSLARDFDIVAIPWTDDAAPPNDVADAIKNAADGVAWRTFAIEKPHGRLSYSFVWDRNNFSRHNYCDLSVMPRTQ